MDATDVVTWVSAPITVGAAGAAALELDERGWESWAYANQGQCIASVVANENSGH